MLLCARAAPAQLINSVQTQTGSPNKPVFWSRGGSRRKDPATNEIGHLQNPWTTLEDVTTPSDFIAVKLDIDAPHVELPLVQQLLQNLNLSTRIDGFYFEHHIDIPIMQEWWGTENTGLYIQVQLRQLGVAAHSWPDNYFSALPASLNPFSTCCANLISSCYNH